MINKMLILVSIIIVVIIILFGTGILTKTIRYEIGGVETFPEKVNK
jgi:hypothetical protein